MIRWKRKTKKNKIPKKIIIILIAIVAFIVFVCVSLFILSNRENNGYYIENTQDPKIVYTQVAQTVVAGITQNAPIGLRTEIPKKQEPTITLEPTGEIPFSFLDGTYRIGIDIPAGTYLTSGSDSCYWERLSGFGGTFDEIIANDNPDGQAIVTILPTDTGFSSQRCGDWVLQE